MLKINNNFYLVLRIISYFLVFYFYLLFMQKYSPLGTDWLDWHYSKIDNYVQHLKLNGYLSNYGFSIWNPTEKCYLDAECWENSIYLSQMFSSKVFYLLINDLFGQYSLKFYGQFIDKIFIFFTAALISEILINYLKDINSNFQNFFLGSLCFTFFVVNPWTYKMLIASWDIIFFLSFFILGLFLIFKNKIKIGIFIILISGFFEYQSSAGIATFYFFLILLYIFYKDKKIVLDFFPFKIRSFKAIYSNVNLIILILFLPLISIFILKYLFEINFSDIESAGSSLIVRIGISGDDNHNGGIVGALQFIAGNRITLCFENNIQNLINNLEINPRSNLMIYTYNCVLSHLGLAIISIISIFGLLKVYKQNTLIKVIVSPLIFLIFCNVFILQQSSSVHLMGYSYIFSIIFSIGLSFLIFDFWKKYNSKISIVFLTPVCIGIIFLCIRVSMLTGINS